MAGVPQLQEHSCGVHDPSLARSRSRSACSTRIRVEPFDDGIRASRRPAASAASSRSRASTGSRCTAQFATAESSARRGSSDRYSAKYAASRACVPVEAVERKLQSVAELLA